MKVKVLVKDQFSNVSIDIVEADDFTVVDGALLVFNDKGRVVASYAAGYWISATPQL